MRVGCPKEIKVHEYRVGLTPESAAELVRAGHEVFLETKAGEGIGAPDIAPPSNRVGVADALGIYRAQPGIKAVVAHPQGHITDAGNERLVEIDASVLHAQRIETAFAAVLGPFR